MLHVDKCGGGRRELAQHCHIMDASKCREYAQRCIELANDAPDREQSILFDLAAAWFQLAAELDHDETTLSNVKEINVLRSAKPARAPGPG